jgi:hypothetical protein
MFDSDMTYKFNVHKNNRKHRKIGVPQPRRGAVVTLYRSAVVAAASATTATSLELRSAFRLRFEGHQVPGALIRKRPFCKFTPIRALKGSVLQSGCCK